MGNNISGKLDKEIQLVRLMADTFQIGFRCQLVFFVDIVGFFKSKSVFYRMNGKTNKRN